MNHLDLSDTVFPELDETLRGTPGIMPDKLPIGFYWYKPWFPIDLPKKTQQASHFFTAALKNIPRTGKTTVARLIGRYLYAHGVLPRDTFVERNALALKGGLYGGHGGLVGVEPYTLPMTGSR